MRLLLIEANTLYFIRLTIAIKRINAETPV